MGVKRITCISNKKMEVKMKQITNSLALIYTYIFNARKNC